jgi:hypothetical protein
MLLMCINTIPKLRDVHAKESKRGLTHPLICYQMKEIRNFIMQNKTKPTKSSEHIV